MHWAAMLLMAVKTQAEIVACTIGDDMVAIGRLGGMEDGENFLKRRKNS